MTKSFDLVVIGTGAYLLGPRAEEVINLFAIAIRVGLGAAVLKKMICAHPSSSSDIGYMIFARIAVKAARARRTCGSRASWS